MQAAYEFVTSNSASSRSESVVRSPSGIEGHTALDHSWVQRAKKIVKFRSRRLKSVKNLQPSTHSHPPMRRLAAGSRERDSSGRACERLRVASCRGAIFVCLDLVFTFRAGARNCRHHLRSSERSKRANDCRSCDHSCGHRSRNRSTHFKKLSRRPLQRAPSSSWTLSHHRRSPRAPSAWKRRS